MRDEVEPVVSAVQQIVAQAKAGNWEYVWQHMTDELRRMREGKLDGWVVSAKTADRMSAKIGADAAEKKAPGSWDAVFAAQTDAVRAKYAAAEQATGAQKMIECVKLCPDLALDYTCLAPSRVRVDANRAEVESPGREGDTITVLVVHEADAWLLAKL